MFFNEREAKLLSRYKESALEREEDKKVRQHKADQEIIKLQHLIKVKQLEKELFTLVKEVDALHVDARRAMSN